MADRDVMRERGRSKEEDYFRELEQRRLAALQRREGAERTRSDLAQALGTTDPTLVRLAEDLGLGRDTVVQLLVVPLVQMAWRDGGVGAAERTRVLQLAAARGVMPGSVLHDRIEEWLSRHPGDAWFAQLLEAVKALLGTLPDDRAAATVRSLMADCQCVARASGGLLGIRPVTAEEQRFLMQLEDALRIPSPAAAPSDRASAARG